MNAVELGLVSDGFTWPMTLGFAAFVGTLWLGVKFIQAWDRAQRLDAAKARHPAGRARTCVTCDQPADCTFPGAAGPVYACRTHAGRVSAWCGLCPQGGPDQDACTDCEVS